MLVFRNACNNQLMFLCTVSRSALGTTPGSGHGNLTARAGASAWAPPS